MRTRENTEPLKTPNDKKPFVMIALVVIIGDNTPPCVLRALGKASRTILSAATVVTPDQEWDWTPGTMDETVLVANAIVNDLLTTHFILPELSLPQDDEEGGPNIWNTDVRHGFAVEVNPEDHDEFFVRTAIRLETAGGTRTRHPERATYAAVVPPDPDSDLPACITFHGRITRTTHIPAIRLE